jgi:8-oxo-dGTP pyrophosphatase MutT (NUDIX family)
MIDKLKQRLQHPLPGVPAQYQMANRGRMEAEALADKQKARKSAVLIFLYEHEGHFHFPLIQRPEYGGVHSKQMAFPGGSHDPSDQDLIETALRECFEEIGVQVPRNQVIGQLTELYIPPSNFLVTPIIAYGERPSQFVPDAHEVAQVFEVPLKMLPSAAGHMRVEVKQGVWWQVPGYEVFGQTVWGATAMMLSELLEVWKEI